MKTIRGKYYVYKERGIWLKGLHKTKILSDYLGKINYDGQYIKKRLSARDDLENAKALIAERGGEIIWHEKGKQEPLPLIEPLTVNEADLILLTSMSMNSRLPMSRVSKLANLNEQTAYSRVKNLERRLGIKYLLQIDVERLGFTAYLILVKFEGPIPDPLIIKRVLESEPRVQFAAMTKGEYDLIIYVLDESSAKAEDNLWKIMSSGTLNSYKARWYLVPFGQINSFVPLRQVFIENILRDRLWQRSGTVSSVHDKLMHREFSLLKELNNNASMDFAEIDKIHGLGRGASRYAYYELKNGG